MLHQHLEQRLREAVSAVLPDADATTVLIRPCADPRFGDYQCNTLISLAKARRLNPRQLASEVLARLEVGEWCEPPSLAGAGFINFRLKTTALNATLQSAARGEHLFFRRTAQPRTVVIDFSSPNVAKPMHVGHIRSTILGDCLARTLRLLGHHVITDNHTGDWGTQFGMLLIGWKRELDAAALRTDPIGEMERIYRKVSAACEQDPAVREEARLELVKLQQGDAENLALWREMLRLSQAQFDSIYARLGIRFDHTLGESFYNPRLKGIVDELLRRGIARESEGAVCVFSDGTLPPKEDPLLKQEDGDWRPNPCLIQKSDGGFNYATTDLATLEYRLLNWRPHEIIYVTDGRQQLHFRQFFSVFRRWHPESAIRLEHVWFGSILGEDGKPFKTRSGETVRLADLLDEAEERAFKLVSQLRPDLPTDERANIGRVVGLGAVKYADLLPNRQTDYVFSWDKMLSLTGNTAPYVLYAYTRTRSLARKAAEAGFAPDESIPLALAAPEELALARHLLNFGIVLEAVAADYRPNYLCNYLYELAGLLSRFWENCPVLKASEPERTSRLQLGSVTGRVLKQGLEALGLETAEQM